MAGATPVPELRLLCEVACTLSPTKIENTEVIASLPLFALANSGNYADAIGGLLNTHMEDYADIMDDEEELDERIAYEMSGISANDIDNDGDNFEPIITGLPSGSSLKIKFDYVLNFINAFNPTNILSLNQCMDQLYSFLKKICNDVDGTHTNMAYVYNNIIFFDPSTPAEIKDTSLFPKYSFNILCRRDSYLLPRLLTDMQGGIGTLLQSIICDYLNPLFVTILKIPDPSIFIKTKIIPPNETNKLWQVKLTIFDNDFTFISIHIISMAQGFFNGERRQNTANINLTVIQTLCFSLYNKCLSRDFNCLCSLSELDIKLFNYIYRVDKANFDIFIRLFLTHLSETQLNVKKQYFIMGLHNLATCISNPNYTPETKAYELLFNPAPTGIGLFYLSMCFIKQINTMGDSRFGTEQIRFAMGGGKLYSIFQIALGEQVKPAADADYGIFYPEDTSIPIGLGATCSMAICMLLQLSLKHLFTLNLPAFIAAAAAAAPAAAAAAESQARAFLSQQAIISYEGQQYIQAQIQLVVANATAEASARAQAGHQPITVQEVHQAMATAKAAAEAEVSRQAFLTQNGMSYIEQAKATATATAQSGEVVIAALGLWRDSEIDIGNSCIGNPPTTLSSLRLILKNITRFYGFTPGLLDQYNDLLGDPHSIKATISPYDFVLKGSLKNYIYHILEAVKNYNVLLQNSDHFVAIADFLSKHCMITNEGFSSPLKGIFDIFYTLFIIEKFANRTFVTQKINKELKRVAICAKILGLHYTELRALPGIDTNEIDQIIAILTDMVTFGYDGGYSLMNSQNFSDIMQKYVQFTVKVCSFCLTAYQPLLFFSTTPPTTLRVATSVETKFMNLIEISCLDINPPTLSQPIYTSIIDSLLKIHPITTGLYNNKLYASCRDAENKKEGIVAIMSAYQTFLWDTTKVNSITPDPARDICNAKLSPAGGIIQCIVSQPTIFNELAVFMAQFQSLDYLDLNTQEGDNNTFEGYEFESPQHKKLFFFFSWFITSIFGVKTKSKNTKVISLGRTYLRLFLEHFNRTAGDYIFFGCNIRVTPAAIPAPPNTTVALVDVGARVNAYLAPDHIELQPSVEDSLAQDRLCLSYTRFNIQDAINKYIKLDIEQYVLQGIPAEGAEGAKARAQNDIKLVQLQVQDHNIITIRVESPVFMYEIFNNLIIRFSSLPRGRDYIVGANKYMYIITMRICSLIDNVSPVSLDTINVSISTITGQYYPFRPKLHDTSKFMMLLPEMKTAWSTYFINKILSSDDPQIVFDNIRLLVLLFNYIGPIPKVDGHGIHRPGILEFITPLIIKNYKPCMTDQSSNVLNQFFAPWGIPIPQDGGSITRSNRGKKLITDLNKHNHKHNKLARNNRTHRNKNKRKKNSKSKSHKPKPNPKSKPKSRKSKSGKSRRKNVTFKRRKRSNRH